VAFTAAIALVVAVYEARHAGTTRGQIDQTTRVSAG
jgi:hypothetical protein